MTLDIPHRSFVATAARVVDTRIIRRVGRWEDKCNAVSAKALMFQPNSVSSQRKLGPISPLVRARCGATMMAGQPAMDPYCPGVAGAELSIYCRVYRPLRLVSNS